MSQIKLVHPSGKKVSFEFGHAERILKLQRDKNHPEKSRWKMENKVKQNDNNSGNSKQAPKKQKE